MNIGRDTYQCYLLSFEDTDQSTRSVPIAFCHTLQITRSIFSSCSLCFFFPPQALNWIMHMLNRSGCIGGPSKTETCRDAAGRFSDPIANPLERPRKHAQSAAERRRRTSNPFRQRCLRVYLGRLSRDGGTRGKFGLWCLRSPGADVPVLVGEDPTLRERWGDCGAANGQGRLWRS